MNKIKKALSLPLIKLMTFLSVALMTTFCFSGAISGQTQAATAEQQSGAIDPLFESFKSPRPDYKNLIVNSSAGKTSLKPAAVSAPADGELDPSLNVNIDSSPGNVRATVVQADGKILVGGFFRTVNGLRRKSLARLNADYSLDTTFSAEINGTVLAVAVQTDGKIVIGGSFTIVGGANRNRIARLNSNGSLDTSFNPGDGADGLVYDVAIQTDGKIVLGGNFYGVGSKSNYAIARLNADGSADSTFTSPIPFPVPSPIPPIPGIVYSIALQTDGKIVIGGFIVKSYNPVLKTTPIARLNQDGSFDSSFANVTANSNALKVAVQPDGKILMAGFFTTINGISSKYIARFNADGSLDQSFNIGTGADRPILTLALQPDGKILIGGNFNSFNAVSRNQLARLNADGSLDTNFNPGSNSFLFGTVYSISLAANGKIVIGGDFFGTINFGSNDAVRVFNADGSTTSSARFETTALGGVRAIAVQPDGKILVGGNFDRPGSPTIHEVFRLNPDGSIDTNFGTSSTSFGSSSNGQVNQIIVQPDGKIIVVGLNLVVVSGGNLGFITGIVRLNSDGTPDNTFTPANIRANEFNAAALQPDGKIIVVWGSIQSNGFPTGGIARLNSDGSIDGTFTNSLTASFFDTVVVQPDGKILIGGPFSIGFINSQTGSIYYNGVIRLNADGSTDTTFVPATTSDSAAGRFTGVYALSLGADGKILVGGRIYAGGNTTAAGLARLNSNGTLDATFNLLPISSVADVARVEDILPLSNGKILIGGSFDGIGSTAKSNVARLNADGSLDNSFVTNTDNTVYKITGQTNGKVLIGGDFETVNGVVRTSLARLLNAAPQRTKFDFDGDGRADVSVFRPDGGNWYVQQSSAGFTGTQFGVSADKLVPADFDGDGKTDLAVYRNGTWYLNRSGAGFTGISFGAPDDIPQPADFDGDGKADLAVWRPSNGTWYVYNLATGQFTSTQFGSLGDKPVSGDYNGDGKADYAVYRPSNGTWYIAKATGIASQNFDSIQFGDSQDKPVAADYDGDGKTDVAVFRPSNGVWYRLNSSTGQFAGTQFGVSTDLPVPADYDGDGKTDLAVFRSGIWYVQRTTAGFLGIQFGASTDKPVPNAFVP